MLSDWSECGCRIKLRRASKHCAPVRSLLAALPFQSAQRCSWDRTGKVGSMRKELKSPASFFCFTPLHKSQLYVETLPYKIADLQAKPWWILCQGTLIGRAVVKGNRSLCHRNWTTSHLWKYLLKPRPSPPPTFCYFSGRRIKPNLMCAAVCVLPPGRVMMVTSCGAHTSLWEEVPTSPSQKGKQEANSARRSWHKQPIWTEEGTHDLLPVSKRSRVPLKRLKKRRPFLSSQVFWGMDKQFVW